MSSTRQCRICHHKVRRRVVKARGGEKKILFHCTSCDFAFFAQDYANLITANQFEQERLQTAGLSIPDIKIDFDNGFRQSLEYKKAFIRAADQGKQILEIGPSWGYFLKMLKSSGIKPVGLEANPVRAQFIRRNLHIPCYEKLEELENKDMQFSKIFLFYVIQYIKNPVKYLFRLLKLLHKGGYIYIITPNHRDVLMEIWKTQEYREFFYEKMTVSYYSVRSLQRLARAINSDESISFQLKTQQGYSLFNHVMWYFNGKPRTTGVVGGDHFAVDIERKLASSSLRLGFKLAKLFREFDYRYRSTIEKDGRGNQLLFIIQKES